MDLFIPLVNEVILNISLYAFHYYFVSLISLLKIYSWDLLVSLPGPSPETLITIPDVEEFDFIPLIGKGCKPFALIFGG